MMLPRVIPCLLLRGDGLVKTVKFDNPKYVGDPINAVRIFNEKEVDELVFLDITATCEGREPNYNLVEDIASEAFMPLGYGGGINSVDQIQRLISIGVEKVIINNAAVSDPALITKAAQIAGNQSVVVSIDAKRGLNDRHTVFTRGGTVNAKTDPVTCAQHAENAGAGEIFLTAIDRDGVQSGYDIDLIEQVSAAVSIPVVACGGAGELAHLKQAVASGASAVAAGSMFVFHGKHRAVLITYPDYSDLQVLFAQ